MLRYVLAATAAMGGMTSIGAASAQTPEAATVQKSYFAVVNANGSLVTGRFTTGATSKRITGQPTGAYQVTFPVTITKCAYIVTAGSATTTPPTGGANPKVNPGAGGKTVQVRMGNSGSLVDYGFHLAVLC